MGSRGRRESIDPREVAMERMLERCAALDVHKRQVTACVHVPDSEGRRSELRAEFSTVTSELLALRDWLTVIGARIRSARSPFVTQYPSCSHCLKPATNVARPSDCSATS